MSRKARLTGLAGAVAALHVAGWGLFWVYGRNDARLAGLGLLAYALGLRHAFDVDHLAAIDNTTRTLLARGRSSLGVGFFFSLGHSSIVLGLVAAIVAVGTRAAGLSHLGGSIGTGVSGTFLLAIGLLNLAVLLDLLSTARRVRAGDVPQSELERCLTGRGLVARLGLGRLFGLVGRSWHAFPIGLLFALGFDTASEIALLALAAGATGGSLPVLGVLALPLLFSAGMVLLDSADGVLMAAAYGWAVDDSRRRLRTNGLLTGLSVAVALAAGSYQLLRLGSPLIALTLVVLLTLSASVVTARSLRPGRAEASARPS
jgi:nickel/cobalt transporter (NiCoT) family protein